MAKKNQGTVVVNPAFTAAIQAGQTPAQAIIAAGGAPSKGVPRPTTPPPVKGRVVPGVTSGTPGAPGSPGTPASTGGIPINPALDSIIGSITGTRDSSISGLEAQKPQVLANYGYNATGYDSQGAPLGLSFDANNPYSRASLLKKNYDQQATGTGNSMAARGQLYSGAYSNAQNAVQSNRQTANDALIKALVASLVSISGKEQTVRNTAETQIAQARGNAAPTT